MSFNRIKLKARLSPTLGYAMESYTASVMLWTDYAVHHTWNRPKCLFIAYVQSLGPLIQVICEYNGMSFVRRVDSPYFRFFSQFFNWIAPHFVTFWSALKISILKRRIRILLGVIFKPIWTGLFWKLDLFFPTCLMYVTSYAWILLLHFYFYLSRTNPAHFQRR